MNPSNDTSTTCSICPKEFFPHFSHHQSVDDPPSVIFVDYNEGWKKSVDKFKKLIQRSVTGLEDDNSTFMTIFISRAWHTTHENGPYYDNFAFHLAKILKDSGFEVLLDLDHSIEENIVERGIYDFMQKIKSCDVVISLCTPLYKERSTIQETGVNTEVNLIINRLQSSPKSKSFYIPVLLHACDPSFNVEELRVGQGIEEMKQVVYLDLRNSSSFLSNIWQIYLRLWVNTKLKWEKMKAELILPNESNYEKKREIQDYLANMLKEYLSILNEMLRFNDLYDIAKGQSYPYIGKSSFESQLNALRILTTLDKSIKPDVALQLVKDELDKHKSLLTISKDRDIVVFFGNTGVGKSTIINFLGKKPLKIGRWRQNYELINNFDTTAMKIGHGLNSETAYPQYLDVDGLLYFDLPGFVDSNGSIKDLVNASFIYQVLVKAKSVRFVFVLGQEQITSDRGVGMKTFFEAIFKAASNFYELIRSNSMLVLNKTHFPFDQLDEAVGWFQDLIAKTETSHSLDEQLMTWLNSKSIGHIPHPSQGENIITDPRIRDLFCSQIQRIQPALHDHVKLFKLSQFYPPDVRLPLQGIFLHMIETNSSDFCKEIAEMIEDLEIPQFQGDTVKNREVIKVVFDHIIPPFTFFHQETAIFHIHINEINERSSFYQNENNWNLEIWPKFEQDLQQQPELKLLSEVYFDIYDLAKEEFHEKQIKQIFNALTSLSKKIDKFTNQQTLFQKGLETLFLTFFYEKYTYYQQLITEISSLKVPIVLSKECPSGPTATWDSLVSYIGTFLKDSSMFEDKVKKMKDKIVYSQNADNWNDPLWKAIENTIIEFPDLTLLKNEYLQIYQLAKDEFRDSQIKEINNLFSLLEINIKLSSEQELEFEIGKNTIFERIIENRFVDSFPRINFPLIPNSPTSHPQQLDQNDINESIQHYFQLIHDFDETEKIFNQQIKENQNLIQTYTEQKNWNNTFWKSFKENQLDNVVEVNNLMVKYPFNYETAKQQFSKTLKTKMNFVKSEQKEHIDNFKMFINQQTRLKKGLINLFLNFFKQKDNCYQQLKTEIASLKAPIILSKDCPSGSNATWDGIVSYIGTFLKDSSMFEVNVKKMKDKIIYYRNNDNWNESLWNDIDHSMKEEPDLTLLKNEYLQIYQLAKKEYHNSQMHDLYNLSPLLEINIKLSSKQQQEFEIGKDAIFERIIENRFVDSYPRIKSIPISPTVPFPQNQQLNQNDINDSVQKYSQMINDFDEAKRRFNQEIIESQKLIQFCTEQKNWNDTFWKSFKESQLKNVDEVNNLMVKYPHHYEAAKQKFSKHLKTEMISLKSQLQKQIDYFKKQQIQWNNSKQKLLPIKEGFRNFNNLTITSITVDQQGKRQDRQYELVPRNDNINDSFSVTSINALCNRVFKTRKIGSNSYLFSFSSTSQIKVLLIPKFLVDGSFASATKDLWISFLQKLNVRPEIITWEVDTQLGVFFLEVNSNSRQITGCVRFLTNKSNRELSSHSLCDLWKNAKVPHEVEQESKKTTEKEHLESCVFRGSGCLFFAPCIMASTIGYGCLERGGFHNYSYYERSRFICCNLLCCCCPCSMDLCCRVCFSTRGNSSGIYDGLAIQFGKIFPIFDQTIGVCARLEECIRKTPRDVPDGICFPCCCCCPVWCASLIYLTIIQTLTNCCARCIYRCCHPCDSSNTPDPTDYSSLETQLSIFSLKFGNSER
jgi:hypothetical protein